jgi:CRP-like cAMP-binding protein
LARRASGSVVSNRLLGGLLRRDRERFVACGERVELAFGQVLCEPDQDIRHVYFPFDSFVSLAAPVDSRSSLEVGLIGNEGMFGIPLVIGIAESAQRAVVRGAGGALRVPAAAFHRELGRSEALRRGLNRYLYALMAQFAQTAACTRYHLLEARLARWLLMTRDRAHSDGFHLTHDFLADMLGVRRVGVTKAAGALQRNRLISYRRGHITVLDRAGLEVASCGCYRAMKQTYDRFLS